MSVFVIKGVNMKNETILPSGFPLILLLIFVFILASCSESYMERRIRELPGTWTVQTVELQRVKVHDNGLDPLEPPRTTTGDLGVFDFTKSEVDYDFIADDSLFSATGPYSITKNEVTSKIIFTQSDYMILLPPDDRVFELIFNDSGSDTKMFMYTVLDDSVATALRLTLRRS